MVRCASSSATPLRSHSLAAANSVLKGSLLLFFFDATVKPSHCPFKPSLALTSKACSSLLCWLT